MSVIDRALSQIRALQPYRPGKPVEELERELGIRNAIKLASNENPLGCSPRVREALAKATGQISLYPDANAYYLKQQLAEKHQLGANQITIGNGSNDVLDLIARSFLTEGREAIFSQHGFLLYALVTQACGATARIAPALPRDSLQPYGHDLAAMLDRIDQRTAVIFIANPNNPTGTWLTAHELQQFIQQVPEQVVVVIDEAYFEYVLEPDYADTSPWLQQYPNLIVTRTFSKIYGLAGLRLGYALSSAEISDLLNRVRQPFNANILALLAARESLLDDQFVAHSIENNLDGLKRLGQYCEQRGLFYIPSVANFLSIDFADRAELINQQLMQKGIIVRPIDNYQLHGFLRISIGAEFEMDRLLTALDELL